MKALRPAISLPEPLEARIAPATIYSITADGKSLFSFNGDAIGDVSAYKTVALTGLFPTETVKALDFRPATGELYGLIINEKAGPDEGLIGRINPNGIIARVSLTPFATNLPDGSDFGFDFNPVADAIRVVSDSDVNLRVNPDTGALLGTDTALSPGSSSIVAVAYDRNFDGGTQTTLFGLDANTNSLVLIGDVDGSPNSPGTGIVTPVGDPLGVSGFLGKAGFDIDSKGNAFALLNNTVYTIDLESGVASLKGGLSNSQAPAGLNGMAIQPGDLKIFGSSGATFTDEDGDRVTLKTTKGTLTEDSFRFASKAGGLQLRSLTFPSDGTADGAKIRILASPVVGKGDSFVNVGYINATGTTLSSVEINGDLGQIDAAGIASLKVQSLGRFGAATQLPSAGAASYVSNFTGPVGKIIVKTDVVGAAINVVGGDITSVSIGGNLTGTSATDSGSIVSATGKLPSVTILGSILGGTGIRSGRIFAGLPSGVAIGTVTVGGSVIGGNAEDSGTIESVGDIASVKIGRDLKGGGDLDSGGVRAGADIAAVSIGGSIFGGAGLNSGQIKAGDALRKVFVGRSVVGGSNAHSGTIESGGNMSRVYIGGDLEGGTAASAGAVLCEGGFFSGITIGGSVIGGSELATGSVQAFKTGVTTNRIGAVKVGGDLEGGTGISSGTISATAFIRSVTVGGSLHGSGAEKTGSIIAGNFIGAVTITGDLAGAPGSLSGSVSAATSIKSVAVGGSVTAAGGPLSGILAGDRLGPITIGGDLSSSSATQPVLIRALGFTNPATAADALAIVSLGVRGNVENALILAGDGVDAQIGAVGVGGNWIASSLVASVAPGNGIYGDAGDLPFEDLTPDALYSKIASVLIRGYATGNIGGRTNSFLAQEIGAMRIGKATIPFTPGVSNDLDNRPLGTTGNLFVRELAKADVFPI